MLKDNIKSLRMQKGLSQEELSVKLNVVRQTISKWEQGLSVPDAEMLISISEIFDVPVSTMLGETISEKNPNDLKVISEKLEVINLQLAKVREDKRKLWNRVFIILTILMVLIIIGIVLLGNSYMEWDYSDSEKAVLGTEIHEFIWVFMRIVPFVLIGSIVGIILTRKKQ